SVTRIKPWDLTGFETDGADRAWVVTDGALFLTNDGGANWGEVRSDLSGSFAAVQFDNELSAYSVTNNGRVWKSEDGGQHWHPLGDPYASVPRERYSGAGQLLMNPDGSGWIVGLDYLWKT